MAELVGFLISQGKDLSNKLTPAHVRFFQKVNEIREKYKNEKISAKKLELCYGISESQTLRIINRDSWK